MRVVLINSANVRLGEHSMPENCLLMQFGGSYFVKTDESAVTDDGGTGVVFSATEVHVVEKIDVYRPTSNYGNDQGRRDGH